MKARTWAAIIPLVLLGVFIGVSAFTFVYARGYSYLSNKPEACVNCHVMRDQYTAWRVAAHRFATCNDCHVPHNFLGKYATKMEHGIRHSYVFTFGNPQVIRIKESGYDIVQSNCQRCHANITASIFHGPGQKRCMNCHAGMGHEF